MDVAAWLHGLGLGKYAQLFHDNAVDAEILAELHEADLERLGVPLGHRKKLLKAIAALVSGQVPVHQDGGRPERGQLTVVFIDLVGSTRLGAKLDPEELSEVLRLYQNAVAGEIARLEGHVAKFMGDGVLAYFGWPRAHEDEAERAVRAALSAVEVVARLATPAGQHLAARVGIATGIVVVGDVVGDGTAREELAVGETLNLAARLQELAEPGGVVVSGATRRLPGSLFDLRELGPQHLKGLDAPVQAFVALRERPAVTRFDAHQVGAPLPLIGREDEFALLLERWRRAKHGQGRAVLLHGEPGIGKSRLVRALRETLRADRCTIVRYNCSPFHANSALYPAIEQLERAAAFTREDDVAARIAKLETVVARAAAADSLPYLVDLLGLPAHGRHALPPLTPQEKRARTFRALLTQLDGLAARRPVLVVLEDAHWCDPTTLELFGLVIGRIAALRTLLIVTFRPEFQPPWEGHAHLTSMSLGRLDRATATAIAECASGERALPVELLDAIVARADGIPLFLEELTKAIVEAGLVRETARGLALAAPLPSPPSRPPCKTR